MMGEGLHAVGDNITLNKSFLVKTIIETLNMLNGKDDAGITAMLTSDDPDEREVGELIVEFQRENSSK